MHWLNMSIVMLATFHHSLMKHLTLMGLPPFQLTRNNQVVGLRGLNLVNLLTRIFHSLYLGYVGADLMLYHMLCSLYSNKVKIVE